MHLIKKFSTLFIMCCFLLPSCVKLGQPHLKIEFLTLEYEPSQNTFPAPFPCLIKIERFTADSAYNTKRIIYREMPFERKAYVYYRWLQNPKDMVAELLHRDLRRAGLCQGIFLYESPIPINYIVQGSVNEFMETDTEKSWQAILTVTITLLNKGKDNEDKIIFQKVYSAHKICPYKNPWGLAEAMSYAMAEISAKCINDIYNSINAYGY